MKRIAVVAAKGLGDGLISAVLAHNFVLANKHVVLFSTILTQLATWFPSLKIVPFPKEFDLASFDVVYSQDHTPLSHLQDPRLHIFKENTLNKKKTLAQNFASFCTQHCTANGLIIPAEWQKGKYSKRVVLHPTASESKRMWSLKKFQILEYKLKKSGWHPIFCLTPEEAIEYQDQLAPIHICNNLNDLAGFIAESVAFIGNNSGPGHLASAIGLPTISLFAKKSYSHLWRPAWGVNTVITPLPFLIGSRTKYRHWQTFLTTSQVISAFFKQAKFFINS